MFQLNASGVLIYDNDEDSNNLRPMSNPPSSNLPSVFTFNFQGQEIVDAIRKHGRVKLRMYKSSKCKKQRPRESGVIVETCHPMDDWSDFPKILLGDKPILFGLNLTGLKSHSSFWNITGLGRPLNVEKRTSVLFVSVSFMILMLISLAWLVFYYIQRFRYIQAKDQRERKLTGQAKRALAIISTNVLQKEDLEGKNFNDTCAVCIENCEYIDTIAKRNHEHFLHPRAPEAKFNPKPSYGF